MSARGNTNTRGKSRVKTTLKLQERIAENKKKGLILYWKEEV
jgi:hypothetical protein